MKRYLKLTLAIAAALALLVLIVFTLATTSANMSNPSRPLRVRLAGEPVTSTVQLESVPDSETMYSPGMRLDQVSVPPS